VGWSDAIVEFVGADLNVRPYSQHD